MKHCLKRQRAASFFGLLCLTVMLSGCWDVTTPEVLTVPVLLAIDWTRHQYQVTIEADAPQLMHSPGSGSSGSGSSPTWIFRGSGPSVIAAIRASGINFPNQNPLTLAHVRIVVLGASVLRSQSIMGLQDVFSREPFFYRTFWVLSSSGPAGALAETTNPVGPDPVEVLEKKLKVAKASGWVHPTRFYQIAETLYNAPFEPLVIPIVQVVPGLSPAKGSQFSFTGAFVFGQSHVVGQWTRQQVAIWNLLKNQQPALLLSVRQGQRTWTFEATHSHTRTRWTHNTIDVRTKVSVSLNEVDGGLNPAPASAWLSQELARQLDGRIAQLLDWSRQHQVDILGVGVKVAAKHPLWFQTHQTSWPHIYEKTPTTIHVQVVIHDTGNVKAL